MDARVNCTCPDCNEPMTIRADVDEFPVPSPDLTTDEVIDGFALDWSCPTCDRAFDTKIVAEIDPVPVPWVGNVDGTEACIEVRPHMDGEDFDHVLPDYMEAMT